MPEEHSAPVASWQVAALQQRLVHSWKGEGGREGGGEGGRGEGGRGEGERTVEKHGKEERRRMTERKGGREEA